MPATPWVPQVTQIVDGQQVSAEVVNPIIDQLVQREEYLYEKFGDATNLSVLSAFNQPIHPDEVTAGTIVSGALNVGYYASDIDGQGVKRAVISISTSPTQSIFNPLNSSYPFGIISNVTGTNSCDLWISGLVTFPINIDDVTNGLLQPTGPSTVEEFQVGPYYLSQSYPGKITSTPSGIQVFVGYALSPTQFLLNPNVNQLAQLFINYRFNILDRPTAPPVLNSTSASDGVADGTSTFTSASASFTSVIVGNSITITGKGTFQIMAVNSTHSLTLSGVVASGSGLSYSVTHWTIPNSDLSRLGWVDITWLLDNNPTALAGYTIPANALFLYNVPSVYTTDNADNGGAGSLSTNEKTEATQLAAALPPQPANFSNLTVNGIQQRYRDLFNPSGIYNIDNFGIWWYANNDGAQPWSPELASGGWTPADWESDMGDLNTRPLIYLQFAKFNPDFSQSIVTSITPFNDGSTNNSSNAIQFLDKTSLLPSSYGDLVAKVNLQFNSDTQVASSHTALSGLIYDQISGKFTRSVIPVVSTLSGLPGSGATVTESPANSGNYLVSFQSQGITGQVMDLEPENSELVYVSNSLHTYLNFKYTTQAITYGVVGKIILPEQFPANQNLYLVLHLIGLADVATYTSVGFNFSYNVSTVINGAGPASVLTANSTPPNSTLVLNDTAASPFVVALPGAYKALQAYKYKSSSLMIPAANIGPDSIVNFRLTRNILGGSDYGSDVGLLAVYWSISPS